MNCQNAKQKAEIIRLRLSLAAYKIQTGQTDVPLEQLEVRSLLPPGAYHHGQRRLADAASSEAAVDNYHDGSNSNPASWSFSSSSQGTGYVQRVNHLRHAAGAAIEAVQAKQERRTAWGREKEQQYREWYEQYRHRHHQGSTWDHAAEQDNHDGFSRDQNRQRQPQQHGPQQRQQRQQRTSLGSGRKPLPDRRARESWSDSTASTGTATIGTATTVATTSPHLNRLDLAERALQAHQRLQSRAVTEELPMEHEHEHEEMDSEQNSLQHTHHHHHHHHHQPQQQQRRQYMNHDHNGWVVHPTTENVPEGADDIGEGAGRGDLDDEEEEEISPSRSRSQMVGSGSGYSTEPEPEPGLPSLSPFQSHAAASVEHGDQGEGVDEEEGEEEEQGEDGDEAASGLLSLSRG
ncbi:hypothetical protein N0V85_000205 [Neurospora sp. IMI 360204]|nr:hypothetical protein N0V85_000205 [Neurospora sp. IMI 360204]